MSGAVASFVRMCEYSSGLADLCDDELLSTVAANRAESTRAKARFLLGLAEFHARQLATSCDSPSTIAWLQRRFSISQKTAYDYLRVGKGLREFRVAAEAMLAGEITYSDAKLIFRYMTPDNELQLVDLAIRLTYNDLKLALAGWDSGARPRKNRITYWVDEETSEVSVSMKLDGVLGNRFLAALKRGELAMSRDVDPAEDDAAVAEEVEQRRASRHGAPLGDALVTGLIGMINLATTVPRSAARAPGAQVNVILHDDGRAYLPSAPARPSSRLYWTLLGGDLRATLLDGKGVAIYHGRRHRLVTDSLMRALLATWNFVCATPGCPHTRFFEAHHLHDWRLGGQTDPDNLVPLCSACHARVTNGEIKISRSGERLWFSFADGQRYCAFRQAPPERVPDGDSAIAA